MVILMNNLILWCSLQIVALYYINLNPQPSYDAQSWYEYQLVFLSRNTLVSSFTSSTRVYFFIQTHSLFQKSNPSLVLIYEMLYGRRTFFLHSLQCKQLYDSGTSTMLLSKVSIDSPSIFHLINMCLS